MQRQYKQSNYSNDDDLRIVILILYFKNSIFQFLFLNMFFFFLFSFIMFIIKLFYYLGNYWKLISKFFQVITNIILYVHFLFIYFSFFHSIYRFMQVKGDKNAEYDVITTSRWEFIVGFVAIGNLAFFYK